MTEVETLEKEALVLLLRSKTALGRLIDTEVHSVLAYLESIGFRPQDPTPVAPPPVIEPPPVMEAPPAPAE